MESGHGGTVGTFVTKVPNDGMESSASSDDRVSSGDSRMAMHADLIAMAVRGTTPSGCHRTRPPCVNEALNTATVNPGGTLFVAIRC